MITMDDVAGWLDLPGDERAVLVGSAQALHIARAGRWKLHGWNAGAHGRSLLLIRATDRWGARGLGRVDIVIRDNALTDGPAVAELLRPRWSVPRVWRLEYP